MTPNEREAQAKQRFTMLNMVRLLGAASALAGAANIGGKLLPDFTPWLGYFLILNAMIDIFVIPALLKKSWARGDGNIG
jgi:hypothetical protein